MITSLQIPDMDMGKKTSILFFLIIYINVVSGLEVPQPAKLVVNILNEEVIVRWKQPVDAPPNSQYNVEMAKYIDEWAMVASCTGISMTYCDLTSHVSHDYRAVYKVRVQLVAGDEESQWTAKKFHSSESILQPPSFTLFATSSTLTVHVHSKPILKEIFPFGVTYTIYLEEKAPNEKNTTAYLKDNTEVDQKTKTFSSLRWGREYCVSVKIEGNGAMHASNVSHKECLLLPEQEWFIIAVTSLCILAVLAIVIIATIILRRPEKTPAVLKSPVSGWVPLSAEDIIMEVVTDKGWFLSSNRTEVKNGVKDPGTHITVTEDDGEEDRRTSMDSGVGMESNCAATDGRGSPPMSQEDSGCGSLGGAESSTSCQTDYPLQDERADAHMGSKREDSGMGLGCQLDSSSTNLVEQDSGPPNVAGGNYRSQGPSTVQIHVCDDEELFEQMLPASPLAAVVTGYRAGPQSCICSGAGQCTWCHQQGHYETEVIKQYRTNCIENGLLMHKSNFVDSYKGGVTFSSYQTQMDTVVVDDLETTFIQLKETFPLLTTLSSLPLVEGGQDFNMNNVPLSLCDIQLKIE